RGKSSRSRRVSCSRKPGICLREQTSLFGLGPARFHRPCVRISAVSSTAREEGRAPPCGWGCGSRRRRVHVRSGFVAVAGRPNVGKSTLVNALAGGKVAIVSDKPQTTRRRIFGIANGDDYQLVLGGRPGFQRPRDPLTERMQRTVDRAFDDVDGILFVLSARERI